MAENTTYSCDANSWIFASDPDYICNDGTSDYKLIIERPWSGAVGLESAFLELDHATYYTDAWCLPDNVEKLQYTKSWSNTYPNNTCSSGYTAYADLCIDQEPEDCAPYRVMLYFDMENPNETSYNAGWADATYLCVDQTSEHCTCATGITTFLFSRWVFCFKKLGF